MTLPARATIIELDPEGLGTIRLDDGSTMRFGKSACRDFVPAVGMTAWLIEYGPNPRALGPGMRAKALSASGFSDEERALRRAEIEATFSAASAECVRARLALSADAPDLVPYMSKRGYRTSAMLTRLRGVDLPALTWDRDLRYYPLGFYDPTFVKFGSDGGSMQYGILDYPPAHSAGCDAPIVGLVTGDATPEWFAGDFDSFVLGVHDDWWRELQGTSEVDILDEYRRVVGLLEAPIERLAGYRAAPSSVYAARIAVSRAGQLRDGPSPPDDLALERWLVQRLCVAPSEEDFDALERVYARLGWTTPRDNVRIQRACYELDARMDKAHAMRTEALAALGIG